MISYQLYFIFPLPFLKDFYNNYNSNQSNSCIGMWRGAVTNQFLDISICSAINRENMKQIAKGAWSGNYDIIFELG